MCPCGVETKNKKVLLFYAGAYRYRYLCDNAGSGRREEGLNVHFTVYSQNGFSNCFICVLLFGSFARDNTFAREGFNFLCRTINKLENRTIFLVGIKSSCI